MSKLNSAMTDLMRYNGAIIPRRRSVFNKNHSHATTFNAADLVPIMWDRVLPGDEKKIRYSGLARMATPRHPTMDEAYLYSWAFYIPDRLWYADAKKFYGENLDASFNPDGEYQMPSLSPSRYMVKADPLVVDESFGSLNDYFGFPIADDIDAISYTDLPDVTAGLHRSYQLVWNEYFRNSSVQPALQLNDGPTVSDDEWNVIKSIRKVCKLPDYFTSALRTPQAGDDVILPLGEWAPVVTRPEVHDNENPGGLNSAYLVMGTPQADGSWNIMSNGNAALAIESGNGQVKTASKTGADSISSPATAYGMAPANLWASLTDATAATINNLRAAITAQQFLEISAIGGKRYQTLLQAHFGTFIQDAVIGRPELLGACVTPVGMRQVLQTSGTVTSDDGGFAASPQGNAAAVSVTNIANEWLVNKAFLEPGFLLVVCAVRNVESYSQGIDCLLTKINPYDHYWPVFDNLGNQPIYNYEIFAEAHGIDQPNNYNEVFGYKPCWQEYKFKPNRVSGLMRPQHPTTLASWNYSSDFESTPILNSEFVEATPKWIERTVAVTSEPQFLLDSYFEYTDFKNMSVHGTPGLTRL